MLLVITVINLNTKMHKAKFSCYYRYHLLKKFLSFSCYHITAKKTSQDHLYNSSYSYILKFSFLRNGERTPAKTSVYNLKILHTL